MKRLGLKTQLIYLFLFYSLVAVWAVSYYSKEMPLLRGESYQIMYNTLDKKEYKRFNKPSIAVLTSNGAKVVKIGEYEYKINEKIVNGLNEYTVTYPSGIQRIVTEEELKEHTVIDDRDRTISIADKKLIGLALKNKVKFTADDYDAQSIVKLAYEKYYEKRGNWLTFLGGSILFSGASLLFYNKLLQIKLFQLFNHRRIDKQPSDFYFTATKTGSLFVASTGLILMIAAL